MPATFTDKGLFLVFAFEAGEGADTVSAAATSLPGTFQSIIWNREEAGLGGEKVAVFDLNNFTAALTLVMPAGVDHLEVTFPLGLYITSLTADVPDGTIYLARALR